MNHVNTIIKYKKIHQAGITGEGVNVAVVDSGIVRHPDFENRIIELYDKSRYRFRDDSGHGTHIAGILAGSGKMSYGKYAGIAPKAGIIAVKVLDNNGNGKYNEVINGIKWVTNNKDRYNIKIMNLSFGANADEYGGEDSELVRAVDEAWDKGIIVVAAAGNEGPKYSTITTPGISRKIITVGACYNKVMDYSGRGPTKNCIIKPDVCAPSEKIISCNSRYGYMINERNAYIRKSGTSMATPIVSGAIALLLQTKPYLTGKDVKMLLRDNCKDLGYPHNMQGWGMINLEKLIKTSRF